MFCIVAAAAVLAFERPACAQGEAVQKLEQGLKLLRAGDKESTLRAMGLLREAAAMDPSSEEVIGVLGQAEWQSLINLMASGAEGANTAKLILDIATPILPERAFNEEEMKALVTTAVTAPDYSDRFEAQMSLARTYGEFCVPELLTYLGGSDTDRKINAHVTLMSRLGRDAVLPLNEAVLKGSNQVRFMVAGELGTIGDERSLAALAEAVGDSDPNVRDQAAKSFAKLKEKFPGAEGLSASDLYLRLARLYYAGDYRVMGYADVPVVLWSWTDSLTQTPTPRHLYVLKLAEEACYDALRLDENNGAARALLCRVLASEKIASDVGGEDDELSQKAAADLKHAAGTAAAMGWDTLTQALGDCLDQQDHGAAIFILGVMPRVYGGADFTGDNAVVRATASRSSGVRLAAAEAVLRFNASRRITAFPDPDGFLSLVAGAVGEVIPRQILVADSDDARRNKMLTALGKAKYLAYDARTGGDAIVRALRFPGLDLIVLSADLGDMDTLAVIRKLKEEDRTKDIPLVVVGTAAQAGQAKWRQLYQEKASLAGIPDDPGLAPANFMETVKGSFGGESPGASARYARSASVLDALAGTDTGNALFNWNSLTGTLTELLKSDVPNDPPVRLHALHALGNLADPSSMGGLVAFYGSTGDSGLKAAAADAIAAVCRATATTLDDGAFTSLLTGATTGDANVRTASFSALGSAKLDAGQMARVAMDSRPGAAPSEGGGGGDGCSDDGCSDDGCSDDGCSDDGCGE